MPKNEESLLEITRVKQIFNHECTAKRGLGNSFGYLQIRRKRPVHNRKSSKKRKKKYKMEGVEKLKVPDGQ